jgi:hypothetical protein
MHSWVRIVAIAETLAGRHHRIRRDRAKARQRAGGDVIHCIDDRRRRRKEVRLRPGPRCAIETGAACMAMTRMLP